MADNVTDNREPFNSKLEAFKNLANGAGYLYNNGSGTLSYAAAAGSTGLQGATGVTPGTQGATGLTGATGVAGASFSEGAAVSYASGLGDVVVQLNALLKSLKDNNVIG